MYCQYQGMSCILYLLSLLIYVALMHQQQHKHLLSYHVGTFPGIHSVPLLVVFIVDVSTETRENE